MTAQHARKFISYHKIKQLDHISEIYYFSYTTFYSNYVCVSMYTIF